ncbi:hypothetical protein CW304_32865 [Bacillus sp. UFRGS-B20]|nr:hypothetical protein CW304_32865 [Bacillus sp. UFRGS-B20]
MRASTDAVGRKKPPELPPPPLANGGGRRYSLKALKITEAFTARSRNHSPARWWIRHRTGGILHTLILSAGHPVVHIQRRCAIMPEYCHREEDRP